MILEAKCLKCGQIFNPHSEAKEDLEHGTDNEGIPCGGAGELLGHWTQTGDGGLSVEALDAAIDTYLGGHNPGSANRAFMRGRFQLIAAALAPHILAAVMERDGQQQWRVTGNPGPQFGLYSFTWPRRGFDEDGEEQARKFMAMFHEPGRTPWPDGPHLHHRTVYTHEGDWIPARPACPKCGSTNTDFDGVDAATAEIFWCRDCSSTAPYTWNHNRPQGPQ